MPSEGFLFPSQPILSEFFRTTRGISKRGRRIARVTRSREHLKPKIALRKAKLSEGEELSFREASLHHRGFPISFTRHRTFDRWAHVRYDDDMRPEQIRMQNHEEHEETGMTAEDTDDTERWDLHSRE